MPTKPSASESPSPARSAHSWPVPLALFVVAVAVYIPALGGVFVWDDLYSILDNTLLHDGRGLWRIWTTVGQIAQEDHYWPLTYTVLWIQWQLWGDWPPGFHFTNLLLNGAVVVQLWRLMRRIGLPGAALAALLFAFHPIHVESVAWVMGLKDLAATLCYLIAIEFYLNHEERGGRKWLAATVAIAAVAMLFKSSPITLPAGLALLIWYRRGRIARRELAELAILAAIVISMAWLDIRLNKASWTEIKDPPGLAHRLAQSGWSFWFYVWKLVWPANLSAIYPQWKLDPARVTDWLPLAAALIATVALWVARRRIGRGPLACWLFYGITLAPIIGVQYFHFMQVSPVADRYQYLASVGPFVGVGVLAGRFVVSRQFEARALAWGASAIVLVLLGTLTLYRQPVWRGPKELFGNAVTVAPESVFGNFNLGCAYLEAQQFAQAEQVFARTLKLKPDYWDAVCNLQSSQCLQDKLTEAAEVCRDAIARGCDHSGVLNNYAEILMVIKDPRLRDPAKALEYAKRSLKGKDLNDPYYMHVYAKAQLANGRREEGIATARKAIDRGREIGDTRVIAQIEATLKDADKK